MSKRSWILGLVAVSAVLSTGCSTLPRARSGEVEEVDMLADVELTETEAATAQIVVPAAQRENSTEVAWTPSGKNIQLAKLPKVRPVTASMLSLDKRAPLLSPAQAAKTDASLPPRGLSK